MNEIYGSIINYLASEHLLYDTETAHGTNFDAQENWTFKLESE